MFEYYMFKEGQAGHWDYRLIKQLAPIEDIPTDVRGIELSQNNMLIWNSK